MLRERPDLRNRSCVYRDRRHAAEVLAELLAACADADTLVLGIPAGGVPVAIAIAERLKLAFAVIPVSKILFPWTTESGFGAVAFDGTEWINDELVQRTRMDTAAVAAATAQARDKVRRRFRRYCGGRPFPQLADRSVILVDDGIAAGSTMRAAIGALRKQRCARIIVAVPTGHGSSLRALETQVEEMVCANVREGLQFAVADAYEHWSDVGEDELDAILGLR